MRAIIVDDEQDSRNILSNYLKKYCPNVEIMGTADSVATGVKAIEEYNPDIVFLDIEMPYGNGFDLLSQVNEITFETVFVTAYDNYAVQALNQSAAYYLLKPIDIDDLIHAVEKIEKEKKEQDYTEHSKILLENLKGQKNQKKKIMLPTLEGFELITIEDIIYCKAEDNFTEFHLTNDSKLLICKTLKYFDDMLKDFRFCRIHRSHLINLEYVRRYTKGKGGFVTMKSNIQLEVASSKKKEFIEAFK
jgi:two-component system LytT family response regulator